jgi:hypothetical protein
MICWHVYPVVRNVLLLTAAAALLLVSGCYEDYVSSQGSAANNTPLSQAKVAAAKPLPSRGKQKLASAPTNAVFGMIYINTMDHREYIYDGADWVPHDQTVDDYYKAKESRTLSVRMPASEVLPTGTTPVPTGAHGLPGYIAGGPTQHGKYECRVCHYVGGVLMFDPNGLAVALGKPLPSFDPNTKTCSNIACHGVPAGSFSYYFPDGTGEPALNTVTVFGNSGGSTPSWYAAGGGACGSCHANPPKYGTDGSNVWHSGYHGGQGPTGARNQCQFCHPDASGTNGQGTTITNPSLHGNGAYDVVARFTSTCFGCH